MSVHDHAELDAGAEHDRQRVAQRGLGLHGRGARRGVIGLKDARPIQVLAVNPSDRALVVIDQQEVVGVSRPETVAGLGPRLSGARGDGRNQREVAHARLPDLRVVDSMHERKAMMVELSDGFIALPGGIGTFEELCETLTWAQLGLHDKPCALLDVAGFYAPLLALLDRAVDAGFLRPAHRDMLLVDTDPDALLSRLETYTPPVVRKWIG